MCGRYTFSVTKEQVARAYLVELTHELAANWPKKFNICPSEGIVCVFEDRDREGERRADIFNWGLVPHWAKDPNSATRPINARSESMAEKPTFREAVKYRRCVIPASGYFEWSAESGRKQPYYIHRSDGQPFSFAGLWDVWQSSDGSEILSACIVTVKANETLCGLHHRMPLTLESEEVGHWLNYEQVSPLTPEEFFGWRKGKTFKFHPVSQRVNKGDVEGEDLIEPVELKPLPKQLDLF